MTQVFIPTNKGTKTVAAENIIRIEAKSNYCRIYFSDAYPLTVAKVLHWFEETLPESTFCRVHRAHIINKGFIAEISIKNKITLMNGECIQASRRRKKLVKEMVA